MQSIAPGASKDVRPTCFSGGRRPSRAALLCRARTSSDNGFAIAQG